MVANASLAETARGLLVALDAIQMGHAGDRDQAPADARRFASTIIERLGRH
jgi:hypothetical protein